MNASVVRFPGTKSALAATLEEKFPSSAYAACLLPLLESLSWKGSDRRVAEALPLQKKEFGQLEFLDAMASLGFSGRSAVLRAQDIDARLLPCLFVPEGKNAPRVFIGEKGSGAGTAWFFRKVSVDTDVAGDKTLRAGGMPWSGRMLRRFSGLFRQAVAASLALSLLALATPLFTMLVYDRVIGGHSPETLLYLVAGAVLAILVEGALRFLRAETLAWLGARIGNIVSAETFRHVLYLPPSHTETAPVSVQLSRLKAFQSVRDFLSGAGATTLLEFPFALLLVAAVALIAGWLALIPVTMGLAYGILLAAMAPKLKRHERLSAQVSGERQRFCIETLAKMQTLRLCGAEDAWLERYRTVSGEAGMTGFRAAFLAAVRESLAQGIYALSGVATVFFGVGMIWNGTLTAGGLMAVMMIVWRVLGPLQSACLMLPRFKQVKESLAQIDRLMAMETESDPHAVPQELPAFQGRIEFSGVGLRHGKETNQVISGLNFAVEPGETIAISGGNGSGKTTVLKLANGLYRPQSGAVRIDGVDIRQMDAGELRRQIAYMPQDPDIFEGTLADNLLLADPLADTASLWQALETAGMAETVRALPSGLETEAKSLPMTLCYQLGLARAFLSGAAILLFDELPYAVLNGSGGAALKKFIAASKGKRTILMVTHRRDFIALADKLVALQQGGKAQLNIVRKETRRLP